MYVYCVIENLCFRFLNVRVICYGCRFLSIKGNDMFYAYSSLRDMIRLGGHSSDVGAGYRDGLYSIRDITDVWVVIGFRKLQNDGFKLFGAWRNHYLRMGGSGVWDWYGLYGMQDHQDPNPMIGFRGCYKLKKRCNCNLL